MLDYVVVEKEWRRSGIGQRLMETVEKELLRQGCRQIHVGTLASQAPDFYCKQGYEFVTKVPHYIGKNDFLFFRKFLKKDEARIEEKTI